MTQPCVFCRLVDDPSTRWIASENDALALEPLAADSRAPGHTLVIPRRHREGLFGPTDDELSAVMTLVRRSAAAMRDVLGSTGTMLVQGSGPAAGGTVPHLHFHVIPCWADDRANFWPTMKSAHAVSSDPYALIAAALV